MSLGLQVIGHQEFEHQKQKMSGKADEHRLVLYDDNSMNQFRLVSVVQIKIDMFKFVSLYNDEIFFLFLTNYVNSLSKLQAEFDFIELSPECIRQRLIGSGASDTKRMSRRLRPELEMEVIFRPSSH